MPVVAVAMRVGSGWQFALNALTFVPELVNEVGRPARPWVVRVGDFSVVEAYESERGRGVPSSEPRTSRNVVEVSRRASLVRVGT
jgi:hypothetical protein